jgi:hypothetical protein
VQRAVQNWLLKQQKKEFPWSPYGICEVLDNVSWKRSGLCWKIMQVTCTLN